MAASGVLLLQKHAVSPWSERRRCPPTVKILQSCSYRMAWATRRSLVYEGCRLRSFSSAAMATGVPVECSQSESSFGPHQSRTVKLEDILAERGACGVGFIANLQNSPSHSIIQDALTALGCMEHRGGCSADNDSGDGAGLMTRIPWSLLNDWFNKQGFPSLDEAKTGVGMVFLPTEKQDNQAAKAIMHKIFEQEGLEVLGWRSVPVNALVVGYYAKETLPSIEQVFVKVAKENTTEDIERELYISRKLIEKAAEVEDWGNQLYFCSFSNQTIVYKGMLRSQVLGQFYLDLQNELYMSSFAIYHRRYSTNTSPRWPLAQPMRFLGHNGEINTIQGNLNWMRSREASIKAPVWRGRESEICPYGNPKASDSANLDSVAELLIRSGRSPEEALMILVPEAYKKHPTLAIKYPEVVDFYEYYKGQMEAWDGPALLLFSDGKTVGACLDRNGLRPARYWRTKDDIVYVASEVGVLPMDESKVTMKGRLGPGMMIAVDLEKGEVYENTEVKKRVAMGNPYRQWLEENSRSIKNSKFLASTLMDGETVLRHQQAYGYSSEDVQMVIENMASQGKEPTFCMGDDIPLAVLSRKSHMLYDYFKQRFAQVTNPAIDPLREGLVMSLEVNLGKRENILEVGPQNAAQVTLSSPVLNEGELDSLKKDSSLKPRTLPIFFDISKGLDGSLQKAINRLCEAADEAVRNGSQMLILSDRADQLEPTRPAIPLLLAVGAVHQHLIQNGLRMLTSIVADSAQCFSTHHFACLIGYGASAVCPYLALETSRQWRLSTKTVNMMRNGKMPTVTIEQAQKNFCKAVESGLLKILSKMGISLLSSYCGAQIFEIYGLGKEVVDLSFCGSVSQIAGLNLDELARESLSFWVKAFSEDTAKRLENFGFIQFRPGGEYHGNNPEMSKLLHKAVRQKNENAFAVYQQHLANRPVNVLRDLLEFKIEYNKAGNIAEQALSSIRTVYSFVGEKRTEENYAAALNDLVKLGMKQGLPKGLAIGSNGVAFAIWALLSWYASRLVMYEGESGGRVFATGLAFVTGGLALGTALPNLKYISEACFAADRIAEMIERVPTIDLDDSRGQVLEKVYGELDFKDVGFVYPSRPHTKVLNNFCLNIPGGQTVALVGSSGSGKSTAIALLERFYDPVAGDIMVDGINIKNLQLRWWRNQIGLVSQEPALFATSILENIGFGNEGASMEDVVAAAMAANAHNFIAQLPDGYNTQVGEGAIQMSGGQKQRIAIARAIIKNPPILLLDEATSALDAVSEKIVQQALDRACMGRTTVVVAHRLSTIQNANKIVVVQKGQVIESGLHEDLINQSNGLYNMLWSMQQQHRATIEEENSTELEDGASSTRTSNLRRLSISSPGSGLSNHLEDMSSRANRVSGKPPSFCKLLTLTTPEWKKAILGSACALVYGAVQPIYAFVLGSMISAYFIRDHQEMKSKIRAYDLVFFSLFIISFTVNLVQHYNFAAMGELITKRIRQSMLAKVMTFEVGWYDQAEISPGAICSMLANEANVVKSLVTDRISLMIHTSTAVILATALGMAVAWRLAIVMIAIQPLTIMCVYTRKVLLKSMSKKSGDAQNQCSQIAAEAVANHRTITALCSSERVLSLFRARQICTRKEAIKQSWLAGIGIGSAQSLTFLTWGFDYWYGGRLVHQGLISPGDVFKTFFILVSTGRVIAEAGSMTSDLAKGSAAFKSVFEILDRVTKINPDDPQGTKPLTIQGNIEFRRVDFAYPARPHATILKDFNLKVSAGSSIALVGPSGSGKSTIIGLVERFYDPLKGTITVDGMDIKRLNLRGLRKHIALVGQEPVLFAGSIKDNILYGSPTATEAEIIQAATAANAHHFISNLKDGYETKCGDRGMQLSGGQKQRIAIARAIIKNPRILLLDEATSALDGESEKVVQAALDRVMVGLTTVLIAHRFNTIWAAQSVAVLHNGLIVERGTPPDLLSRRGAFYDLLQIQQHQ